MNLRRFRKEDAKSVADLIRRNDIEVTSKYYPKELIEVWGKGLSPEYIINLSKGKICYVAEEKKKIIGYICLEGNLINKLFVLPQEHKKSIGSLLLSKIESICNKKGFKKIVLDSNISSEGFYLKKGFKKVKTIFRNEKGIKFKVIQMEKILKC